MTYLEKYDLFPLINALLLVIQFVNAVLVVLVGDRGNVLSLLFLLLGFLLVTYLLLSYKQIKIDLRSILFVLFVFSFYLMNCGLTYNNSLGLVDFISCCLLPFIISSLDVDQEKTITWIVKLSILALPASGQLFSRSNLFVVYSNISMGLSYAFLPIVVAAMVHFVYYRKRASAWIKFAYIVNAYYLFKLLTMGSRGVVLSLFCGIFLLIFFRFDENGERKGQTINYYFALILVFSFGVLIIINVDTVMAFLYNLTQMFGLDFAFLDKTLLLDDVTNGRIEIYKLGITEIINSPIFGNGIGTFQSKTGFAYPHNLFIQLLYEGGLLLTLPFVFILARGFHVIFRSKSLKQGYPLFIVLFTTAIPRLMFSGDFWNVISFWMLIGFLMRLKSPKRISVRCKDIDGVHHQSQFV